MPRPAPAEAIFMKVSCLVLLLTASPEPRAVLNNNTFTLLPSPMEGAAPPPMGDRTMVGYELRKAGAKKMLARAAAPPLTVFVRQGRRVFNPYSDRKSTRLNSSHANISYAVFCLKKKTNH